MKINFDKVKHFLHLYGVLETSVDSPHFRTFWIFNFYGFIQIYYGYINYFVICNKSINIKNPKCPAIWCVCSSTLGIMAMAGSVASTFAVVSNIWEMIEISLQEPFEILCMCFGAGSFYVCYICLIIHTTWRWQWAPPIIANVLSIWAKFSNVIYMGAGQVENHCFGYKKCYWIWTFHCSPFHSMDFISVIWNLANMTSKTSIAGLSTWNALILSQWLPWIFSWIHSRFLWALIGIDRHLTLIRGLLKWVYHSLDNVSLFNFITQAVPSVVNS